MRTEADVSCCHHGRKPDLGSGALATNMNVHGFERVAFI